MKFTREVELAVELLSTIPMETPISARKLAVQLNTSEFFLQRIIPKLRRAELVQVKKGPDGGVFAGMTPGQFTVLDVVRALGKAETDLAHGSILDRVHTNILNLLGTEWIPRRESLETGDGDRGGA